MNRSHTVETERLLLRPFQASDVAAYASIRSKPNVVRWLPGGAGTARQADETAQRLVSHFASLWQGTPGYGPWAVVEKASGELRGHLGLRLLPELGGQTELLYLLDDVVWGSGYATEGAIAALGFGFDTLQLDRIIAMSMPENTASLNVIERLGMKRQAKLVEAFGLSVVKASIDLSAWRQRNR